MQARVRALLAALGSDPADIAPSSSSVPPSCHLPLPSPVPLSAAPADAANLVHLLQNQLASMVAEAAGAQVAAATAAGLTSLPSLAAPIAAADTAPQPVSSTAATLPAAVRSVLEDNSQHSLQPTVSSMHTLLQGLAASLAAHQPAASADPPDTNSGQQLRDAGRRMQDAACGTETIACRGSAAGEAGSGAASRTGPAASRGTTAMQPAVSVSSGRANGGGSCFRPDDMLAAAVQRASKWKARCKELRRALAASREAAALCSSLQVGPTCRSIS